MAQTKREHYEHQRKRIREERDKGNISPQDAEAILEWAASFDPKDATTKPERTDLRPGSGSRWGDTREPSTLRQWVVSLEYYARGYDGSILEATADELNQLSQDMVDGALPFVKDSGLSQNTVRARQNCLRKFLQLVDAEAHPDDITIFDSESTIVDPEDMLTQEEFHALRKAPEHPRDSAIVHMFLYTGQRNTAIRTMRIKDIQGVRDETKSGRYRLNPDADGLKGADIVATWNPVLGAENALREWLEHHPAPDDPEAYLFVAKRNPGGRDVHSTISDDTINRVLRDAASAAAEEYPEIEKKPTNAHAMRHNFVTTAKLEWGFDDSLIKRLIRHKPDSDVMSTTYAHLSDEDYIDEANKQFGKGGGEEAEEESMTPNVCDCGEPLDPTDKACPNCGTLWSAAGETARMRIEQAKSEIEDPALRGAAEIALDDEEFMDAIAEQVAKHLREGE